jgi:hypothetical protein
LEIATRTSTGERVILKRGENANLLVRGFPIELVRNP